MQGPFHGRTGSVKTAMAFVLPFLACAVAVFALVGAGGAALGAAGQTRPWRLALSGGGLLGLAAADVIAIRGSRYCPISVRRQTPRALLRRHPVRTVAALWGLDTGLVVTTFRVTAATWGALLLAGLGLCPSWAGAAYAFGFVGPFAVLLWRHPVGTAARAPGPADPGLESMLAKRKAWQRLSAGLLAGGGAILIGTALT